MEAELTPLPAAGDPLVARWRDLAARALEPNAYAEPEMVLPAARWLGGDTRVALLTVSDRGALQFVLPVERRRRMHHVPVPAVTTWLHAHSYLGTPLLAPDTPEATWAAALDGLRRTRLAPRLVLRALADDGPVRGALDAVLRRRHVRASAVDPVERAVLHRRPDGEYLAGRMSGARRKRLRRARRGLAADLGAEVVVVDRAREPAALPAAVEAFLRLEASGWKRRAGTAMACSAPDAAFFRAMCEGFARLGRLGLVSLAAGETDVAMACVLDAGDTAFHAKIAHDETHARWSPGLQLELELVSLFHDEPRWRWIDSGSDGPDTVSAQLYTGRRVLSSLLVPLGGPVGRAASRSTPSVLRTGRLVKRRLAARPAVSPPGGESTRISP